MRGANLATPQMFLSACIAEFLPCMCGVPRTTAFLEVFAGAGTTAKNVVNAGFIAHTFEMLNSDCEDGCSPVHGAGIAADPHPHPQGELIVYVRL